jgi:hypothetical protein
MIDKPAWSLHHEIGHICEHFLLYDKDRSAYNAGKGGLFTEVAAIVQERLGDAQLWQYKHNSPAELITRAFDYAINDCVHDRALERSELLQRFNDFLRSLFPSMRNETDVPFFLFSGNSFGSLADYYDGYRCARALYAKFSDDLPAYRNVYLCETDQDTCAALLQ